MTTYRTCDLVTLPSHMSVEGLRRMLALSIFDTEVFLGAGGGRLIELFTGRCKIMINLPIDLYSEVVLQKHFL